MKKSEISALEKVYAHEIERAVGPRKHSLPFQSKAAVYQKLVDEGLLEQRMAVHGTGPFALLIEGYELTHAGRLRYCASCDGAAGETS